MTRKKNILIAIVGIAIGMGFAATQLGRFAQDASLNAWQNGVGGYTAAVREQVQTTKPIAVFFYADWCASCKKLRETVLSTPEVKQFLGDFITVKVNPEENRANQALADSFGVVGYPTFLVIPAGDGSPKIIHRTSNATPAQFIAQCQEALSL